ncbi:MAG TPA: suppressor of fused domain protein, partial [Leptospiraceae bacterium]|nr:suppressor of fused domain protein [Leptospiraceae bacterium]
MNENLINHIEYHWGKMEGGWREKSESSLFSILKFENSPFPKLNTYLTLGVSDTVLYAEKKMIRQEFLIVSNSLETEIITFLDQFTNMVLLNKKGVKRGEVFGPFDDWFSVPKIKGVYCCYPILISEEQGFYKGSNPVTVFVQIIPIYDSEIELIRNYKGISFENELIENNMDFWDFHRKPFSIQNTSGGLNLE